MTVWTTGNSLGTGRQQHAGCGSSAAGFVAGGVGSGAVVLGSSEEMNGLVWAVGGTLSTARCEHAVFGTQSSAMFISGQLTTTGSLTSSVEFYNGTSFSSGVAFLSSRSLMGACGATSSGLTCGGSVNVNWNGGQSATELFNGSAWVSTGALPQPVSYLGCFG